MTGVKKFIERCCGVQFGPHSFKSGIPKVLVPGCVLMFIAIFFIVLGILLCGVHAAYKVSKVDDTYEDYFLIAGIIALVIGIIIAIVGSVWCCHVKRNLAQEMDYYRDTKLSRSASIRSNVSQGGIAAVSNTNVPQDWRYQPQQSYEPQPQEYPENPDPGYPAEEPGYRESYGGGSDNGSYDPVTDTYVPRVAYHGGHVPLPQRGENPEAVTRVNNKKEHGRNGRSPRKSKVPYSERMRDFQGIGVPEGGFQPESGNPDDGRFDLANTYKTPEPRYYAENHPSDSQAPDGDGGYVNIPDTYNAHLPKSIRPASASQAHAAPNVNVKKQGAKKRGQSESVVPHVRPDNADTYKYNQGRPLDSSTDSTAEKTTLVYNPKDGRWYYYFKGRPVSEYTGDNPERDANEGPTYRYINGKPVIVNNDTITEHDGGKSKRT